MKISNLIYFSIFFADLGEHVSTWILARPPGPPCGQAWNPPPPPPPLNFHVVYGWPLTYIGSFEGSSAASIKYQSYEVKNFVLKWTDHSLEVPVQKKVQSKNNTVTFPGSYIGSSILIFSSFLFYEGICIGSFIERV